MSTTSVAFDPQHLDLELLAIDKWYEDAEFREAVKTDARRALHDYLGVEFPDDVTIHMHEETRTRIPIAVSRVEHTRPDLANWQQTLGELYVYGMHGHRYRDLLDASIDHGDARARLSSELGVDIPHDVTVDVFAQTANDVHVCVPNPCQKEEDSGLDLSRNPRDFWILTLLDLLRIAKGRRTS